MAERFIMDDAGSLVDMVSRTTYDYVSEVCPVLNKQDIEIKRLKKENRGLEFKIIDMLDFVKEKGTVTREEIKNWWNGDVE